MKVFYKDMRTSYDLMKSNLLKTMVKDLCNGVSFEELYTATNENGESGIFCHTVMGGKKFWNEEELVGLYARKNREKKRIRL